MPSTAPSWPWVLACSGCWDSRVTGSHGAAQAQCPRSPCPLSPALHPASCPTESSHFLGAQPEPYWHPQRLREWAPSPQVSGSFCSWNRTPAHLSPPHKLSPRHGRRLPLPPDLRLNTGYHGCLPGQPTPCYARRPAAPPALNTPAVCSQVGTFSLIHASGWGWGTGAGGLFTGALQVYSLLDQICDSILSHPRAFAPAPPLPKAHFPSSPSCRGASAVPLPPLLRESQSLPWPVAALAGPLVVRMAVSV